VAVCDPSEEARSRAGEITGAVGYSNLGEMIRKEDIDAAYVCVPISAHGEVEEVLAENGIPMLIEKPLSPDPSVTEGVGRAIRRSGVISSVGYHWRYGEATEEASRLIGGRSVGMVVGSWMTYLPRPDWWRRKDSNPAQIFEQTTHLFDLSRYLVGEISEVYNLSAMRAMGEESELDDVSTVSVRFDNGAIGSFSSTYMISYRHRRGLNRLYHHPNRLARILAGGTRRLGLWHPGYETNSFRIELMLVLRDMVLQVGQGSITSTTNGGRRRRRSRTDPYLLESRAFVEAVRKGDQDLVRSDYDDAAKTHEVVMSAIGSAEMREPVRLG
jgi:predicted dehydrogenase